MLRQRCDLQERDVAFGLEEFMDRPRVAIMTCSCPLPMRLV